MDNSGQIFVVDGFGQLTIFGHDLVKVSVLRSQVLKDFFAFSVIHPVIGVGAGHPVIGEKSRFGTRYGWNWHDFSLPEQDEPSCGGISAARG